MAGLGDLFGRNGVLEQLMLWGLMERILESEFAPLFTALQQDVNAAHPLVALPVELAAEAYVRGLVTKAAAQAEAARNGIDPGRFATMTERARVRIDPADLAEAVLRSYLTATEAEAEAKPQGITPAQLRVLTDLAGDAPGPLDLARALLRGIIPATGRGPASTSYEQGIAESRLHNKWGPILEKLAHVLLSPPDAAAAVVRNFMPYDEARRIATEQGVDPATFDVMRHLAGDAPGPQQLAEALRRGLVPRDGLGPASTSFLQGIAEGRLADKWAHVIEGLAKLWPSPTDALDAQVKGQLTPEQGRDLYELLGGDPQFHDWLFNTIGEGPTPLEAAIGAARGIIPEHGTGPEVTSYDQAVRESRYRNKWTRFYREVSRYVPPPETIALFLAHQLLDHDQAATLLAKHDMDPATVELYLGEGNYTAISDYRGLTQGAVVDMYYAHLLPRDQAVQVLGLLHVTKPAAELLLDYADLRQVIDSIQRSVQRIAGLFTGRKISVDTARSALTGLGIPAQSVEAILQTWEIQAAASVKTLTEAQIVDAWRYGILADADALAELEAIGYTPYDAWILLSLKAKGPLPGGPPRAVAPPPATVIPGTT